MHLPFLRQTWWVVVELGRAGVISKAASGHSPMRSRPGKPWQALHTDTDRNTDSSQ